MRPLLAFFLVAGNLWALGDPRYVRALYVLAAKYQQGEPSVKYPGHLLQ